MSGTAGSDLDWQCNKSLAECNAYMLQQQLNCDVSFLVGEESESPQRIQAHRYMLAARSPVFFAMMCGDLQETSKETIKIPDVEPEAFKVMLRYLYTEEVKLTSDLVLAVLYISKKYMLPALTAQCFNFLEENLNPDSVGIIMEQSILYDETVLTQKCQTFLESRNDDILRSPVFKDLSKSMVKKLLSLENLMVSELEAFNRCLSWAKEECVRQEIADTPDNMRSVLSDILFMIHFPCMTMKEFSKYVSKSGILTAEERCMVYEYIAADYEDRSKMKLLFPCTRQVKTEPSVLTRFSTFGRTVIWSGDCSIIRFRVMKAILLKGFGFSSSMSYDPISEVQFSIKEEMKSVLRTTESVKDNQSGDTIRVNLQKCFVLQPETWYTLSITVHFAGDNDQGYCRLGKGKAESLSTDGVLFEFDKPDSARFLLEILFCKYH